MKKDNLIYPLLTDASGLALSLERLFAHKRFGWKRKRGHKRTASSAGRSAWRLFW